MFVCDPCLKKHYTNSPGLRRSHGRCELCNVSSDCSDIPSRYLVDKPKDEPRKDPW